MIDAEFRGVKKRPNRLGVTEGARLSLRRDDLVGERRLLAGDEEGSTGLEVLGWLIS